NYEMPRGDTSSLRAPAMDLRWVEKTLSLPYSPQMEGSSR
ncbi:HAP1 isoform 1, partial [Pongo abelii]